MIPSILPRAVVTALGISCLCALSAPAQSASSTPVTIPKPVTPTTQITPGATAPANAPAKKIGAAPANSKQAEVLASAMSPKTRQTLQEAMNAMFDDEKPQRSSR